MILSIMVVVVGVICVLEKGSVEEQEKDDILKDRLVISTLVVIKHVRMDVHKIMFSVVSIELKHSVGKVFPLRKN